MKAEKTIRNLLTAQAERRGEAIALRSVQGGSLTFAALLERVKSIRGGLREVGVRRGDRVAIVMPNGLEMGVAFLGAASIATAAPLNPIYKPNEFEFYLDDLRPKAVILADDEHPLAAVARSRRIPIIADTFNSQWSSPEDDAPHADDVALILHTSGTTSRPKMVPLTQGNLCASAQNISDWLQLTSDDCCLNVMPLFHIHGLVAALLASLHAGGSVICTPGFVSTEIFGWLRSQMPTWYTAVPTMHQAILARPEAREFDRAASHLRFIRSSSAALPPQVAKRLEERFGVPVVEAYGMTEASHQMCCNPLPPRARKFGSVGLPAGPDVAIMNDAGHMLPRGQSGEVVIRGANVTSGYLGNVQANTDNFIRGWFRTGDVGHFDEDGFLYLSGRIKEIINRGGEKISPREVDEMLLDHPAVAEALTFALPDIHLGEEIAAVVVFRPGAIANEADIISFAAEKLAEFKVPRRILIMDEIPKGPTGKPQRIGLATRLGLDMQEQPPGLPHVAPTTETEKAIAAIWQAVLRIDAISTNSSFFDIGGDSILAAQIVARVHDQLGRELPIVVLFQSPTIAAMAQAIDQQIASPDRVLHADPEHLAKLLAEIEAMSEDDARREVNRLTDGASMVRGDTSEHEQ